MRNNTLLLLSGGVNGAAAAANGAAGVCGNQDFLTNLLVYQYLSGNIPSGAAGANPQLAALLGSQVRPAASRRLRAFQIFTVATHTVLLQNESTDVQERRHIILIPRSVSLHIMSNELSASQRRLVQIGFPLLLRALRPER